MALANDKKDWRELKKLRKKRKLEQVENYLETKKQVEEIEKIEQKPKKKSSLAIAIAGSIVDNIQTEELATYVGGQIARAAAIYKVDEVIIFDDTGSSSNKQSSEDTSQTWANCVWLAKVLQFLECPQYLRKALFPISRDTRFVGLLNPLNAPHHVRREEISLYREGVVLDEVHPHLQQSFVNVGLDDKVRIDRKLEPGLRVTVKLDPTGGNRGTAVSPREPSAALNIYWGYEVRLAKSLSAVFAECARKKSYNLTLGTSDKGTALSDVIFPYKKHRRTLVVIGGVKGLEYALKNDGTLKDVNDVSLLFDHYVNVCPDQGSKTIRSEEALLISLALITEKLKCTDAILE